VHYQRRYMQKTCWSLFFAYCLFGASIEYSIASPATPKRPVVNEYHGVKVTDPYQWLEKSDDPAVQKWTEQQNRAARAYLDKLPTREALQYQLETLYGAVSADYSSLKVAQGKVFALKFKPPAQQPVLVTLRSPNDVKSERTVLDPNQLDSKGGTSMDWYEPSVDGALGAGSH